MNTHLGLRTGAVAIAVLATVASSSGAAATFGGTADHISNRETVQADLHPDGTLDVARLFSQLVIDGDGAIHVVDPTATKNIRDLDGFSKPKTSNGTAIWDVDVHGRAVRRTVADFTGQLPVSVAVTYTLNGIVVKPKDVVGKSGTLSVTYTVKNLTEEPTEVTYKDGRGVTQTKVVDVPTPYVGQLQTTLPARFSDLDAPRADIAGDGRGGNLLTWTMVLFSPIGEIEQQFGWSAHIHDGIAPKAEVQVVPVPPKRKPELKFGEDGFSTGAAQATELTGGAGQIDANVVKLGDGASTLLAGLTELASGASDLKAGLAGKAGPGATQLAAGADQIAGGLRSADDGAKDAASGATDLATGAGLVADGAQQVADGFADLDAGLALLSTEISALGSDPGVLALKAGLAAMSAGLGSASNPLTILGALNAVEQGLLGMATSHTAGLPAVVDGVDALKAGLTSAKTAIATMAAAVAQQQALLADALVQAACAATPGIPLCVDIATAAGIAAAVNDGLTNPDPTLGLGAGVDAALAGIGSSGTPGATILYGLASAIAGIGSTTVPGNTLLYGLHQAILGLDHPVGAGGPADAGGISQGLAAVSAGLDQLVAGVIDAVTGAVGSPSDAADASLRGGVAALSDGADQVASGASDVADGASQLSAGLLTLSGGVSRLDDGASSLASGAHDLSSGLTDAVTGSGLIADGANQARDGSKQIADGAAQLHEQGTSKLTAQGNTTAADAALSYARLAKLDEKAAAGGLPYGAPAGGEGSAAYLLTLKAADAQGTEDTGRAALAIGLLVLASAAGAVIRKRVTA